MGNIPEPLGKLEREPEKSGRIRLPLPTAPLAADMAIHFLLAAVLSGAASGERTAPPLGSP